MDEGRKRPGLLCDLADSKVGAHLCDSNPIDCYLVYPNYDYFLLASLLFGVSIAPSPLFLLAVAISGYSMAGVGAIIGFYSPDGRTSSLLTQIVQPIIVFLSPVFVPFEQLPAIFQWTSHFIPTTYVAKAIRDTLANQITESTWASILVVFGITIATLLFIEKGLDWRGGE